jgi:hypothetical protein
LQRKISRRELSEVSQYRVTSKLSLLRTATTIATADPSLSPPLKDQLPKSLLMLLPTVSNKEQTALARKVSSKLPQESSQTKVGFFHHHLFLQPDFIFNSLPIEV